MTTRAPAEVFSPGEYLRDELEARGWSQAEFAEILGRPAPVVSQIITGKRIVSPEVAQELAAALDTSAELWMNLETAYRLQLAGPAPDRIRRQARLRRELPVREMIARGWVEDSTNGQVLEARLLAFLNKDAIEAPPALKFAAKQTAVGSLVTAVQEAWLARVRQLAESLEVPIYSDATLEVAAGEMERLLRSPDEARQAPELLREAGVRFVVVEALPRLGIDGVCFWLDDHRPVIGMSLRYDRIDNFWFVLRHEIEHVLNGDGKDEGIIDADIEEATGELPQIEQVANDAAARFCVPPDELSDFIARKSPLINSQQIRRFARRIDRHPGLVAGQLRRRLGLWNQFHHHLAKIRHVVVLTALVDGFGQRPQLAS